jgi:hypothetical protein
LNKAVLPQLGLPTKAISGEVDTVGVWAAMDLSCRVSEEERR